jgi:serine/threonine-protein kinase PknG
MANARSSNPDEESPKASAKASAAQVAQKGSGPGPGTPQSGEVLAESEPEPEPDPAPEPEPDVPSLSDSAIVQEDDTDADSAPPSIPSAAEVASTSLAMAAPGMKPIATEVYPGDVIAERYEVLGVLGEGGMGIVHRCRDLADDRMVAVKRVIVPDSSHAEEYVMWFYKEARALAAGKRLPQYPR